MYRKKYKLYMGVSLHIHPSTSFSDDNDLTRKHFSSNYKMWRCRWPNTNICWTISCNNGRMNKKVCGMYRTRLRKISLDVRSWPKGNGHHNGMYCFCVSCQIEWQTQMPFIKTSANETQRKFWPWNDHCYARTFNPLVDYSRIITIVRWFAFSSSFDSFILVCV